MPEHVSLALAAGIVKKPR